MRTDIHFICEKCGADYGCDACEAEACEANHPTLENLRIVAATRFSRGKGGYGKADRLTLQWTRPDGKTIEQVYIPDPYNAAVVCDES